MKKLSRKSLILEHYIQTAELVNDSTTVKLWKPKTMGKLPARYMRHVMMHYGWCRDIKASWTTGNYDAHLYDIQLAIFKDPHRKVVDIYICSLIMRPFSQEASDFYEVRMGLEPMDRLLLMWDSRQFDKEGGYTPSNDRNISFAPGLKYEDLFHVVDEHEDIEDSSC